MALPPFLHLRKKNFDLSISAIVGCPLSSTQLHRVINDVLLTYIPDKVVPIDRRVFIDAALLYYSEL